MIQNDFFLFSISDGCGDILNVIQLKELPGWVDVTKIWFDPKNPQNPPKNATFDSVVELRIILDDGSHVFDPSLEHIGPKMNNLETIFLSFESEAETNDFQYTYPLLQRLQKCPNLSDLIVSFNGGHDSRNQAVGALGELSDKSDFSLLAWDSFSQEIRNLLLIFYC